LAPTRPRVLIADDSPDLVKAVSRLLALDCDVVGTVSDGSALVGTAQRLQPDVIVLDVTLPNVHGLEACRQITQAHPQIRVIVFTAMSELDVGERALEVGASAFVSKLGGHRDLVPTIKRLCDAKID
jgi:two-component system invasion response regulator UvrY